MVQFSTKDHDALYLKMSHAVEFWNNFILVCSNLLANALLIGIALLQLDFLCLYIKVFFGKSISPMLKYLSHNRRDSKVIICTSTTNTFSNEVVLPSPFEASTPKPATNLTFIIICASSLIKSKNQKKSVCLYKHVLCEWFNVSKIC